MGKRGEGGEKVTLGVLYDPGKNTFLRPYEAAGVRLELFLGHRRLAENERWTYYLKDRFMEDLLIVTDTLGVAIRPSSELAEWGGE